MQSHFDDMPWEVRNELRNSPYNLCPACVYDIAGRMAAEVRENGVDSVYWLTKATREMEQQIRCQEVPQAQ